MKQTRTTLKELTAMYRAVLRHGILCNAIALGLIATATPAMAEYTNVSLDELYPTGTAGSFKYTGNKNVTWLAENISVTEPGDGRAIEIGDNAMYSANEPTLLHLGGDNTNTININTGGDGILVRTKSVVDVHANDTISITSTVNNPSYDGGVGYGALWVQNSSNPGQTDTYATANLTANQINLTNLNASAIAALSEGRVNINGNATIKGKDAIYASGLSETNINAAGDKTVKMEGDIDFRQGSNSGTPVDATVNVTLNGAESYWTGNTVLSYLSKPSDDKLQINHGATIKMTDGATWTATDVTESAEPGVATNGRYYTALKNLDVNSGNVVVNRANGIEVENLAVGANGLNISNGKMDVSKSLTSGGQIHVNSGAELNINATDGATFANGSAVDYDSDTGGAILNEGTLTLDGAAFKNNYAWYKGGAIENLGTLTISNSSFGGTGETDGNKAYMGGALSISDGTVELDNTTFTGNYASVMGGAINAWDADLTIKNGTSFVGNQQTAKKADDGYAIGGGAIVAEGSALSISDATFSGNTSAENAGAIYKSGSGNTSISGSTFTANSATGDAGNGGAVVIQQSNTGTVLFDNVTFGDGTAAGANHANEAGAIWLGTAGTIKNSTFNYNTAHDGGAVVTGGSGQLTLNNSKFLNNVAEGNGGAIATRPKSSAGTSFLHITGDGTDATMFANNSAANGGAIYTGTSDTTIANTKFVGNTATANGGAIYNEGTLSLTDSVFGDKDNNSQLLRNIAESGGAIYNTGDLTVNGGAFYRNSANAGTKQVSGGGAIYNLGTLTTNSDFANNGTTNANGRGGAIWSEGTLDITGGKYTNNTSGERGGAINISDGTVTIKDATFGGDSYALRNTAKNGGAIAMNKGTVSITDTTIKNNYASSAGGTVSAGGAIYNNKGSLTLTDTEIQDNIASGIGGGIYNKRGNVTINAVNKDVTFSGNKVKAGEAVFENDIYNSGALTLNAAANRTLTLDGGIEGGSSAGIMLVNADVTNTGVVKVAGTLTDQNVTVAYGELHLIDDDPLLVGQPGAYLAGSTINVESGATINTIDDAIQDLSSVVTLADGALVKGDIDYTAGLADKYSADSGANITYKLANALNLSGVQYGSKEIAITNTGATVNADVNFAWFNGDTGLTLTTGGNGTGTVLVSGVAGGINAAVDATDDTVQEVNYALNGNDTFTGTTDNVIQKADFTITGNGNDADADKIVFGDKDMIVDGNSTLTLNDVVLEKTNDEAIVNQTGATLNIKDSRIAVNVNNYGTLVSDPTYYDAKVVNAGDATFTEDVFENGSSLTNSATVNLNNVEFVSGSTLTGLADNVLNVAGTDNKFNGTSTGNNVVLANGAKFVGTLSDGSVDARNGGIDTITGSVSGGDLYVDANLNAGTVDTFGGTTGATVKGIKLAGTAYGDDDKVKLTIGEAALDSDVEIDGTNYFTSVVKDGNDIVFSDKLINESNLYKKLGSWTDGNYIATSADMENVADGENYMTVGQALSALDTNLKTVSTAGTIEAGQTGFVTGDAVYNAFASTTASAADLHDAIADIMAADTSANTKRGALGQLLMTGTVAGQNLTAYTTAEAMASLVTLTGEAMSEYDFGWDINKGLQHDLDNDGKYRIDVLNNSNVQDKTVAGAINANTSAISANAGAITVLNGSGDGSVSKSINDAITAAVGTDGAVTNAINTALVGKQDTLTAGSGISLTDDTIAVSGLTTSNLAADANIAKTQLASSVQDSLTLADSALQADSALNGANLTVGSVTLDKLATTDLSQFDNSTSGFITKDVNNLANYTTTSDMNTAIAAANKYVSVNSTYTDDDSASATGTDSVAVGMHATASGFDSAAFGDYAIAAGTRSIAIGNSANASKDYGIAIGGLSNVSAAGGIAMGTSAEANGANGIALGNSSVAGETAVALGQAANAVGGGVAMGLNADVQTAHGVAIGTGASVAAAATNSVAIGQNSAATEANTFAVGAAGNERRVVNVATGTADTDAVNVKQLTDTIDTALADYTTTADMTDAIAAAKDAAISSANDYTDSAIETALADYTKTTDMNAAIADAITGALDDNGAVTEAINSKVADATTMGTGNKNFDDNVSAKDALVALDTAVGDMGGLANNTIAKEDNVVANLTALDNAAQSNADAIAAIEDGTTVVAKAAADASGNNIETTYATKSALSLMGGTVDDNTAAIATLNGTGDGSVAQAAANAVEQANAYTDARLSALHDNSVEMANAYTDRRIEDLDKNLSAGVAGAVALSAVATSGVERGEVSVGAGYGYFNGQSAAAFGATMGLSNRWSINAGAGISNADVSFRAGTNYKFKLF